MARLTLPQQRKLETRDRILRAGTRIFARKGYGQAAVEDILNEAGISRGAFYHHFSGKDEVFKALLGEHLQREFIEMRALEQAKSLREVLQRYTDFLLNHIRAELAGDSLGMEFWAAAAHDDAIRGGVNEFHGRTLRLTADMLRAGQHAGVVRSDVDVEGAAFLLQAIFEGAHVLLSLDPDLISVDRLRGPWADLLERFLTNEGEGDVEDFQKRIAVLLRQFVDDERAGELRTGGSGD